VGRPDRGSDRSREDCCTPGSSSIGSFGSPGIADHVNSITRVRPRSACVTQRHADRPRPRPAPADWRSLATSGFRRISERLQNCSAVSMMPTVRRKDSARDHARRLGSPFRRQPVSVQIRRDRGFDTVARSSSDQPMTRSSCLATFILMPLALGGDAPSPAARSAGSFRRFKVSFRLRGSRRAAGSDRAVGDDATRPGWSSGLGPRHRVDEAFRGLASVHPGEST